MRARPNARSLLYVGLAGYALLALRTAWICDDAFITLRTASNWLGGHGLTWNVDERVQAFTHPLWLFLLTGAHSLSGEPFYSTLLLSLVISVLAVGTLVLSPAGRLPETLGALLILSFSQAFVDFSSGGLENPLTHLLVAAFASVYLGLPPGAARFRWLAAIAGLAVVNRLDTALLFAPALAACALREGVLLRLRQAAFAALPLLLWEAFSQIYYGFPFPNTAYAKLSHGQGGTLQRWLAGVGYLESSLAIDPLTLVMIASCGMLALLRRDQLRGWLLAGAVAYVLYAVQVGGDFMSGRFLAAPLLLSMCCFASSDWLRSRGQAAAWLAGALACVLGSRSPPPFTGARYGLEPGEGDRDRFGVHDERRLFFQVSSLLNAGRITPADPTHPWTRGGLEARNRLRSSPAGRVQVIDAIGYAGYYAGPGVHIVDRWALADALLARLPAVDGRYGHYPRVIPDGYLATLSTGVNQIEDPNLAAYYDALALAIRGPLFGTERLRAVWELNVGAYQPKLAAYAYLRAPSLEVALRIANPTRFPSVTTYLWNDGRTTGHALDTASSQGKHYDVRWQISAAGATLLEPAAPRTARFEQLRPRGTFALAVAFAPAVGAMQRQVYELRYAYEVVAGELSIQRQPSPAWNANFPFGPWRHEPVAGVISRLDMDD